MWLMAKLYLVPIKTDLSVHHDDSLLGHLILLNLEDLDDPWTHHMIVLVAQIQQTLLERVHGTPG